MAAHAEKVLLVEEETKDTTVYDHWVKELEAEDKAHKEWRARGKRVLARFKDEEKREGARFNILWSNTQVLHAAVLSARPKPDVTRRYKDPGEVSRDIAEVTERALSYSIDVYDFDGAADLAVGDFLLPGLGQARVRYVPYFQKGEPQKIPLDAREELADDETPVIRYFNGAEEVQSPLMDEMGQPYVLGDPEDELAYEEVTCEVVPWDRFRWQPANTWENVNWACIDHYLTKRELVAQFGEAKAQNCPLGYSDDGTKLDDSEQDGKSRALVHEIFDRSERRVIVICRGNKDPLDEQDDPYSLEGFYPFPKPMLANCTSSRLSPVPDYVLYQDQAMELDLVTERLAKLTKELKWRGFYDGSFKDLASITSLDDGEFAPVDDWSGRFPDGRKLEESMMSMPLKDLYDVVARLYEAREQIKQTIYEITGLSDIVRGSTKASETLGAQQLKQQNASLRLTKKQGEVARFFRDIFRIKAELIVEHFSPETLTMMTGIEVGPEMMQVMQNDMLRSYSIDVEAESTVAADQAEEQQNVTELLTAVTSFLAQVAPMIQMGLPVEIAKEMLLFAVRRFKGGRQLEQVLEKLPDGNQGPVALPPPMGGQPPPM